LGARVFVAGDPMTLLRDYLLACCWLLLVLPAMTCETPGPEPTPPESTGGTAGTGGAAGSGGTSGTGSGGEIPVSEAEILCRHLADIGCPEGTRPTCVAEVERIQLLEAQGRVGIDIDCLLLARTTEQARACRSIACGGVE
jgi:hypothetical protein